MNNRLRSSVKKSSELQAKHIRKFKFRGSQLNEGSPLFSKKGHKFEEYVNNKTDINIPSSINRKRKMSSRFSTRSKVAKMDLSEDIQQQIDDQIRMREGAMKLMSACSTLNQALETSKNLLTINGRILGLMSALQKKKQEHVLQEYNRQRSSTSTDSPEDACTGRIAISDMRIPLMWRDNVHFTGKTGDQSYYAFALIRCGGQVRDTPLYEITSADTDMYFDLTIVFDDLTPDFKMDFEVYYTVITSNEAHGVRAPMRPSMKLHTQKRVVQFKAPKFCLAGHVHITIDDIKTGIISKDLTMGGKGASGVAVLGDLHEFPIHPLELWGQICCQLAAQPKDMFREIQKGNIKIELNSPANNYYCILRQGCIHCWESEKHVQSSKPVNSIKMNENMKITQVQSSEVSSIKLIDSNDESHVVTLTFDCSTECYEWKVAIRRQIANVISWKNAFTEKMRIEETKKNRLSIPSKASFYDQILIEDITSVTHVPQSPLVREGIVNEAFHTIQQHDTTLTTNDHTEEKTSEVTTKQNYEKTCGDTSVDVLSSNNLSNDQNLCDQSALLLQNGLPPSNLQENNKETETKVVEKETNGDEKMDVMKENDNDDQNDIQESITAQMECNHGNKEKIEVETKEENQITQDDDKSSNTESTENETTSSGANHGKTENSTETGKPEENVVENATKDSTVEITSVSDKTPDAAEGTPNAAKGTPNATEEPSNATEETSNAPEETPNTTEETPNAPEETPNTTEETPTATEKKPNATGEKSSTTEETPNTTEETPNTIEETPNTTEEMANITDETPNATEETPSDSEGTSTVDISEKVQENGEEHEKELSTNKIGKQEEDEIRNKDGEESKTDANKELVSNEKENLKTEDESAKLVVEPDRLNDDAKTQEELVADNTEKTEQNAELSVSPSSPKGSENVAELYEENPTNTTESES